MERDKPIGWIRCPRCGGGAGCILCLTCRGVGEVEVYEAESSGDDAGDENRDDNAQR